MIGVLPAVTKQMGENGTLTYIVVAAAGESDELIPKEIDSFACA